MVAFADRMVWLQQNSRDLHTHQDLVVQFSRSREVHCALPLDFVILIIKAERDRHEHISFRFGCPHRSLRSLLLDTQRCACKPCRTTALVGSISGCVCVCTSLTLSRARSMEAVLNDVSFFWPHIHFLTLFLICFMS
jgi:hypothetical protein